MTEFAYLTVVIATAGFTRAAGIQWLPALLLGILSPILYLVIHGVILLPVQLALGMLGVSPERLPDAWVANGISLAILVAWVAVGFWWMRKAKAVGRRA